MTVWWLATAAVAGFLLGAAVGLSLLDVATKATEACAERLQEELRHTKPAPPIKVLVIRERGSAEWLQTRARSN